MSYNILITSAGQRVSLVRAFQKELKLNEEYENFSSDEYVESDEEYIKKKKLLLILKKKKLL